MARRFLERGMVALVSRTPRWRERGSQSLEWVTLAGLVATVMTAATKFAAGDGGLGSTVAQAIFNPIKDMLVGGGQR